MTEWMGMVLRGGMVFLRQVLRDAVESVSAADVEAAKAEIQEFIQRQRRLPGTIRRWLCHDVERLDAGDVEQLKHLLLAEINRLV